MMAPLIVPGIASPNLSALVGNVIILASVFILCFAIHKAAPQIVRDYITWPYYLWQVLSFLHQGTIFHSVHLVRNSEDVGLKILGVLVTLLYGVAGPFAMWRWHCRNKFQFRTHEAFRVTGFGKYFMTHGSWGGNALNNHYGAILGDLSNAYALQWMIIFPAFNLIVCVVAAIEVDTSTGCKIQNTLLGLLMIAFAVLHVIMLPRRSLYLNSCAAVSYFLLAVYTFAQAFAPFGAPPVIMIICGIFNTVAGVIAFLASTYEALKVRPVVWPESEDKIPPIETEMEERLVPSRSLGPYPFSAPRFPDPEPSSSVRYITFQEAVDTRPDFPLELCSTVLPSGAKPVPGKTAPPVARQQFGQSATIPAVPQHHTIDHGGHAYHHHQHHQHHQHNQQHHPQQQLHGHHGTPPPPHAYPGHIGHMHHESHHHHNQPQQGGWPMHILEFRERQRRDPNTYRQDTGGFEYV